MVKYNVRRGVSGMAVMCY